MIKLFRRERLSATRLHEMRCVIRALRCLLDKLESLMSE